MNLVLVKLKLAVETLTRKLTFRNAIGISVFLHLFIAVAFASVFVSRHLTAPLPDKLIEFDLEIEQEVVQEPATPLDLPNLLNEQGLPGIAQPDLSTESSPSSSSAEIKPAQNRDALIFASLASLSQLRESFTFLEAELQINSGSSLSPVEGDAPDVSGLAKGLETGFGLGAGRGIIIGGFGGGRGDCPPGGN